MGAIGIVAAVIVFWGEFAWKVKAFYCVLGFRGLFLRKIGVFVIKVNIWDSNIGPRNRVFYENTESQP